MAEVSIWFAYGKRLREKLKSAGAVSEETAKKLRNLT